MEPNLAISSSFIKHRGKDVQKLLAYGIERFEVGRIKQREITYLENFLNSGNYPFGIHSPLPSPKNYKDLTSKRITEENRQLLWLSAKESCLKAKAMKAGYIIFHVPFYSRKACSNFLKKNSPEQLKKIFFEDCLYLHELSRQIEMPVYLEIMYFHPKFFSPAWLAEILEQAPLLGTCLDVGHVHCSTSSFTGETFYSLIKPVLPKVRVVHLYNCRNLGHHKHKPIHPNQKPKDNWIDIPKLLSKIITYNPNCLYVLEYSKTHLRSYQETMEGIHWIQQLLT